MKCPNCQKEIDDGSKFCQECGWKIEQFQPYSTPDNKKRNRVSNFRDKMIILTSGMVMVTLVIIIILMIMNIMDPMDSTQALTDAQNGVVQTSEPMENTQENETENNVESDNGTYSNNFEPGENEELKEKIVPKNPDSPYYHYDGELSDTPITPTEVENADILDSLKEEHKKLKEGYLKTILEYAKKKEVYANPTIVPFFNPVIDCSVIMVDLHTKDKLFLMGHYKKATSSYVFNYYAIDFEKYAPLIYRNIYIFNSYIMYSYFYSYNLDISLTEFQEFEKKIIGIIMNDTEKLCKENEVDTDNSMEVLQDTVPYFYFNGFSIDEKTGQFKIAIDYNSTIGYHATYMFTIDDFFSDSYSYESHFIPLDGR